jgi:catechol 2,3-dioxygenase-like lactoylglutathione lyase family enzyme
MRLTFLYHPVKDLEKAVGFYREVLSWDESWRMGDETAAMQIPESDVVVMLDLVEDQAGPSGFFEVDDVDSFYEANKDRIEFEGEPRDIPPIRFIQFRDPGGNLLRVFSNLEE